MHQNFFDTIKIILDLNLCQQPNAEIKASHYNSQITQAGYSVSQCKPFRFGWHGFNFIKINEVESTVFIEISSKILRENYAQGLHSGNIRTAIDVINRSGLLFISTEALEAAECVWLDPKVDCTLPRPMAESVRIIKSIHVPNKFRAPMGGKLGKRTFQTLYFERNVISDRQDYFFRMYDKGEEIKLKKNLNFILSLSDKGSEVIAQFAGKVRIESSHKTKAAIRKAFELHKDEKTLLLPILKSNVNIVSKAWQLILKDFEQAKPIAIENITIPNMNLYKLFIHQLSTNLIRKPNERVKDISAFTELMAYYFDWESICLFVEQTFPNKNTRTTKRKHYRTILSQWQQFQNQISGTDFAVFAEISEALQTKPICKVVPTKITDVEKADAEFFRLLETIELEPDYWPY